jgi:hypothetical protein
VNVFRAAAGFRIPNYVPRRRPRLDLRRGRFEPHTDRGDFAAQLRRLVADLDANATTDQRRRVNVPDRLDAA